jgi:hypothetical protein
VRDLMMIIAINSTRLGAPEAGWIASQEWTDTICVGRTRHAVNRCPPAFDRAPVASPFSSLVERGHPEAGFLQLRPERFESATRHARFCRRRSRADDQPIVCGLACSDDSGLCHVLIAAPSLSGT